MDKIAFIVVRLVAESETVNNETIEKEIYEEIRNATIPWAKEMVKVSVLECSTDHE